MQGDAGQGGQCGMQWDAMQAMWNDMSNADTHEGCLDDHGMIVAKQQVP